MTHDERKSMVSKYVKRHIRVKNRRRTRPFASKMPKYIIDHDTRFARHGNPTTKLRSDRAISARAQNVALQTGFDVETVRYAWGNGKLPDTHDIGYKTLAEAIKERLIFIAPYK